ncbi:MAG: 4-hydroxythreonine-4-phosphate dehydrogenase PdxA [Candidatus Omnitrophota bacterium]
MIRTSNRKKPLIFITMGDPSGIGPEVIVKSLARPEIKDLAVFAVVADSGVIERSISAITPGLPFIKHRADIRGNDVLLDEGAVNIIDPGPVLTGISFGVPGDAGSEKALVCLDAAVDMIRNYSPDVLKALVTAPLNKEMTARVSPGFIGHTEYLQQAYSSPRVTMVMAGRHMSVVPVTRHIPLRDVAAQLTAELLEGTIAQVIENRALISGKDDAVIGVSALNPHGGEGGKIGREEIDIIAPVVRKMKKIYADIDGPVPADVIFYKAFKKKVDIVVAMYHDQCLSPFKMVDFDTGVNMTLGLGHVRTSPDHGTAYDIAGKGKASPESMEQAIRAAVRAVGSRAKK